MTSCRAFPPYTERLRLEQLAVAEVTDKGHGRITTRRLEASSRLASHSNWPALAQACRVTTTVREKGEVTTSVSYAITSLPSSRASALDLLALHRGHWSIENSLHWVRDVTFGEDKCRARVGFSPQNLSALRNASLTYLRHQGVKGIKSSLRTFATKTSALFQLLANVKQ